VSVLADSLGVPPEIETVGPTPKPPASVLRTSLKLWRMRIGLLLVLIIAFFAIVGPFIAPHSSTQLVGKDYAPPGSPHALFGTDNLGQDIWSRFLDGGAPILEIAIAATALGVILGVVLGLLAAYSRNKLDEILMRSMDVILAFPQIMLALVAIATVGPKVWVIILAVGLTTAPRVARVARGAALPVVERDFVAAAEALGVPRFKILTRELLPNILSPLMVETTLRLTYSIAVISGLAFLGLSTSTDSPDWGSMINQNYIAFSYRPWGAGLPVLAIAVLTIGTGLIGDGIGRAAAGIDRVKANE